MGRCCAIALIFAIGLSTAWADSDNGAGRDEASSKPGYPYVQRYYANTSRFLISSYAIKLQASPRNVIRVSAWLDDIFSIPHGRDTINAIVASGNHLIIRDSSWALGSSGRTLAPVSKNLTNGQGEDVEILFDARIPDKGSHQVYDQHGNPIEFTAVQNLFHELAHAKHLMNGTWLYFDSEGQAIQEENIFRRQLALHQGLDEPALRSGIEGQQFWWPATAEAQSVAADL